MVRKDHNDIRRADSMKESNLINILGRSVEDEEVFNILSHWGLSKEQVQYDLKRDAVVCGGVQNRKTQTNILAYGRKKINELHFWTLDQTHKKEMILPFGISRFDKEEEITNEKKFIKVEDGYFVKNKENYYEFGIEFDQNKKTIERIELCKITKRKYEIGLNNTTIDTQKNNTLVQLFESNKLKRLATYILQEEKNGDLIEDINFGVDWRGYDEDVINDCENILKTKTLKGELIDTEITSKNPDGIELYIHYKGAKVLVKHEEFISRWATITTLNKVINDEYQLRQLRASIDTDTFDLVVLSHKEWQIIEGILDKEAIEEVIEYIDN